MAKKRKARELTVKSTDQLTQNMRRVTLYGEELADFPIDAEGAFFKLVFPGEDPDRPILRTYTVANYRAELNEIDVDFMLHTNPAGSMNGVAVQWAIQAKPGDPMPIFGPGPATFINVHADWFLLAADMTALPALITNLARLPTGALGYVVVEILSDEDRQDLPLPAGMELIWVVNPDPGTDDSPLYHTIKSQIWLDGKVSVWAACEFKTMKKNRHYFREVRNVEKSHLYISSYWKKGLNEEEHKVVKKEDKDLADPTY